MQKRSGDTNAVTATILDPAKIPVVMNNDREALALALRTCNRVSPETARIVRIRNTMTLNHILLSEACLPDIEASEKFTIKGSAQSLEFDESGRLLTLHSN